MLRRLPMNQSVKSRNQPLRKKLQMIQKLNGFAVFGAD